MIYTYFQLKKVQLFGMTFVFRGLYVSGKLLSLCFIWAFPFNLYNNYNNFGFTVINDIKVIKFACIERYISIEHFLYVDVSFYHHLFNG